MSIFEYIKARVKQSLLRFLGLHDASQTLKILSDTVIEHDKMLAINAIVQVRIMSDLNNITYESLRQRRSTHTRKDDDDLEN